MAQLDQDVELIAVTNKAFAKQDHWEDVSLDLTDYVATRVLMKKNRQTQVGTEFQWELKVATEGNAHMTKPYATETTHNAVTMKQPKLPHRHMRSSWCIDERVIKANRNPARLVDIVKPKRSGAKADTAVLLEQQVWGKPSGDDDDESMHGFQYHLPSSTAAAGYNSGLASGFTSKYGIASASFPANAKAWTDTFKQATLTDLVRRVRLACHKTMFKNPMEVPTYKGGMKRQFCTVLDTVMRLEEEAEKKNNNPGSDLARVDGTAMIRRCVVEHVPYLDSDTTCPFYGIDWGTFDFMFLEGEEFYEMAPARNPLSLRVIVTPTYSTVNLICYNPRNNFIIIKN